MSNVPSHSRTRRSHRRTLDAGSVGSRRSHGFSDVYGAGEVSGAAEVYEQVAVDEAGPITEGRISPHALSNIAQFARAIRPVVLVDAMPTLPDTLYPPGTYVSLTTETPLRLYKNEADVWVAAIGPNDIQANSITAAQIAAGAIAASEIAAGAISAEKIAVGAAVFAGGNLVKNGSFESADASVLIDSGSVSVTAAQAEELLRGWSLGATTRVRFQTSAGNAKTGTRVGVFLADSTEANRVFRQDIPVIAGRSYRLSGWHWKGSAGGVASRIRANTLDRALTLVTSNVMSDDTTGTTPDFADMTYTVPSDGTVSYLRVECLAAGTPAGGDEVFFWEDVALAEVAQNVSNVGATVVIDSSGIAVLNGAISLQDEFGATAMQASGFSGTWRDFLGHGLYNAAFVAGVSTTLDLGRTAELPFWTVARDNAGAGAPTYDNTGSAVLTRAADTNMPGGFRVRCTFGAIANNAYVRSDLVPVIPNRAYAVRLFAGYNRSAGAVGSSVFLRWYKEDGSTLVSEVQLDVNSVAVTTAAAPRHYGTQVAPNLARYVQVVVQAFEQTTHHASNSVDLGAVSLTSAVTTGDIADGTDADFGAVTLSGDLSATLGAVRLSGDTESASGSTTAFTITNPGTATFANKSLEWVRIGRVVTFFLKFDVTATGSAAGVCTITDTGLPQAEVSPSVVMGARTGNTASLAGRVGNSGGELVFSQLYVNALTGAITGTSFINGDTWVFWGSYLIA